LSGSLARDRLRAMHGFAMPLWALDLTLGFVFIDIRDDDF
jgi:hypothetical protein